MVSVENTQDMVEMKRVPISSDTIEAKLQRQNRVSIQVSLKVRRWDFPSCRPEIPDDSCGDTWHGDFPRNRLANEMPGKAGGADKLSKTYCGERRKKKNNEQHPTTNGKTQKNRTETISELVRLKEVFEDAKYYWKNNDTTQMKGSWQTKIFNCIISPKMWLRKYGVTFIHDTSPSHFTIVKSHSKGWILIEEEEKRIDNMIKMGGRT
ncbi:hypothetical protein WA026_013471 [Henosepilachna vigintioctopunctata]|uniref:Uncharacterized protein n=1 Tax=Henosepilachna vigintioctopunctata TaxID=420089 RepID=A0AAW1V770_9CUCU